MKDQLKKFFNNTVNMNAPLKINDKAIIDEINEIENIQIKQIKYPYKPFLLLSIIKYVETNKSDLFNSKIIINDQIILNFYNLITNDYLLFSILKTNKSKLLWDVGFNKNVKNSVYSIMRDSPLRHLECQYFHFDKKEKSVVIKIDLENNLINFNTFKEYCLNSLKRCIPWYFNSTINDIWDFAINDYESVINNVVDYDYHLSVSKIRKYQHLFRKEVLDRDQKCLICCTEHNAVLQACHIKPYSVSNDKEKYDYQNGITLCANHHKLFDQGYFSFDQNWNVVISKSLNEIDDNLFFKQYEGCYQNSFNRFANMNIYIDFHKTNIFKRI